MMKIKIVTINCVCILFFLIFGYLSVSAAEISSGYESVYENLNIENCRDDDLKILKGLESEIKTNISELYSIDASLLSSDIDFSNSIKIYDVSDIPVFLSNEKQLSLLKEKRYGYYVYIPVGKQMFEVVVSPDERTKKWEIETVGEAESYCLLPMLSYNIDFLKKYDELYCVGGFTGFFYPVVLCVSDDVIEGVFTLEPIGTYPIGLHVEHTDSRVASFDAVNLAQRTQYVRPKVRLTAVLLAAGAAAAILIGVRRKRK